MTAQKRNGNVYTLTEWAGAFGDLGTLVPFVVAYVTVVKMDPMGVLFAFGIAKIASGLFYRTPVPVQPMKAIGAAAITQAGAYTPGMIFGAGLATAVIWLLLGLTNLIGYVTRITSKPVVRGIVLGLGLLFVIEGIKMMVTSPWVGGIALVITFFLISKPRIPAMFVLLFFGGAVALWQQPDLAGEIARVRIGVHLPPLALGSLDWSQALGGALILALPQVPLTLGNAVISTAAENNHVFPDRPVSERKLCISTGLMNLFSPLVGGVPLCHGAGGMAGHVRFGARTGGALVILGALILVLAIFFADAVTVFFRIFPASILGVILFFAGIELAVGTKDGDMEKKDYYVMLVTAGFAMWNMLAAFIVGIGLYHLLKRGWVRV